MDNDFQPNGQQTAPTAPPPTETPPAEQPAQPSQPPLPAEPAPITPPMPGQVITGGQSGPAYGPGVPPPPMAGGPMAPASAPPSGGGNRWFKILAAVIAVIVVIVIGLVVYQKLSNKNSGNAPVVRAGIDKLNIGILNADFGGLYPSMTTTSDSYLINAQMFDGLVRYQEKGKIAPDLATKWSNPDAKTWLFTIRSGVKFHDGHTLAPADVKYSLDTVKASNTDLSQTYADTIATVDTVGNDQVKITTTKPDPALLNKLAFLYVIDQKAPEGSDASQAGTGPYEIKSGTTPTTASVQMTAFNDYFGGKPTTQALNFANVDASSTMITDFNAGKYDIVGPVSFSQAESTEAGTSLFVTSRPDVYYVGFNTVKAGPLQNKQVREAIRYALSPDSIGDAHNTQVTADSQLVPASFSGYNTSIKPYGQDTAKAKKLLAEAGYGGGLTLTLSTAESSQATNEIVNELKGVGITVNVDQHNDLDQFVSGFNAGQDQMFVVDYSSNFMDAGDVYANALATANYGSTKLTGLLSQASTEMNQSKRQKLLQDAGKVVDQDVAVVPLYTSEDTWLMDKTYVIKQDLPNAALSVYFSGVQQLVQKQ